MGIADLPVMGEWNSRRRAVPKYEIPKRLDESVAADKDDAKQLTKWKREVKRRDGGACRCCGITTVATLELDPKRGEAHHVAGRADHAVRYDVRNGLHVCLTCHGRLTRRELHVVQAAKFLFRIGQRTYINASKKVTFSEKAAA